MFVLKLVSLVCAAAWHQAIKSSGALCNAALYKTAAQSSLYQNYFAYLGNDGQVGADFSNGHCQHTDNKTFPWWMVDLSGQFVVESVTLTNRLDPSNAQRLANFTIDVFTSDPRSFESTTGKVCYKQVAPLNGTTYTWSCASPTVGRFVRISMFQVEYLHFCEFEVCVSDVFYREAIYVDLSHVGYNQRLIYSIQTDNLLACGLSCLSRRSSDNCTAYNWTPASSECQLLAVDPHAVDLNARVDGKAGTYFFVNE